MQETISLPDPPERPDLEPFASIFTEVITPAAVTGGWFAAQQQVPTEDLERISRRIEALITNSLGHRVHAAIYIHALLVCGHFFYQSASATEDDHLTAAADAAFSLVQSLKLHHDLYDLYLLIT